MIVKMSHLTKFIIFVVVIILMSGFIYVSMTINNMLYCNHAVFILPKIIAPPPGFFKCEEKSNLFTFISEVFLKTSKCSVAYGEQSKKTLE